MKRILTILIMVIATTATAQKPVILEVNYVNAKAIEINTGVFFAQSKTAAIGISAGMLKVPHSDPGLPITLRGFAQKGNFIFNLQAGFIAQKNMGIYGKIGTGYSFGSAYVLINSMVVVNKLTYSAGLGIRF